VLQNDCKKIVQFPPGHYWSHKTKALHQYYKPAWFDVSTATQALNLQVLCALLPQPETRNPKPPRRHSCRCFAALLLVVGLFCSCLAPSTRNPKPETATQARLLRVLCRSFARIRALLLVLGLFCS